eukprot:6213452-Karenia_brevis.AAC.1
MVNKWKSRGAPQEPTVINRHWVEVARERWGERWGLAEPVTIATTSDCMDTHLNKYWKIMGEAPVAKAILYHLVVMG